MVTKRRPDDIADVSNAVSMYALVCLIILFGIIVTYGWSTMLAPVITLPHDWPDYFTHIFTLLRYAAGFAIAAAGIILAKAVSAERIRISLESLPKYTNTWKAYFLVLILISALGTMNTMFMQTQQTSVLGDVVSETRNHLQQLKYKIDQQLATKSYDQQRVNIDQTFANFEKELRNPANCGFGAQSNLRFQELQSQLPKLKPLALGSGACQNIDALITGYRDTVNKLTDDLPDPETKRLYLQRKSLTAKVEQTIIQIEEMKVKNPNLDKEIALPILINAWNTYSKTRVEVQLLAGTKLNIPEEIVNKNVIGMGGIAHIIPLLISQFDNPLTYLIIVVAIIFDILLVQFFSRHLHSSVAIREENFYTSKQASSSSKARNLFED